MVKMLDENIALPDHVGWRLWNANRAWQQVFVGAMKGAGHAWFTESRAALMAHIPRNGIKQSALLERVGTTKQAVQQILDGLEEDGVVTREPDPDDKRGRIVRYTEKGKAALRDADRVKAEIDGRYVARLGKERFDALMESLRHLG